MKTKYLPLFGLALGLGIATTSAGDRTFGDGKLPEILEQYDLNGDGQIDEEERQAAKEARRAAREEARAERIAEVDTDGDGELSEEEKEAAKQARRDALEERRAEKFAEIAGEDGCLDADEFAALPPLEGKDAERVAAIFDRLDADDDECVTLEEFTARLRNHRGHGHGHRHHRHHGRGDGHDRDDEGAGDGEGGDDEGGE